MGETDSPDFNKARGYLIGFSTVVLLLWYFGADLSTFKLLGNEIKLRENVQNVWMVLAGINAYLWLRLYQRTPEGSFRFDLAMHELYEKTLIKVVKRVENTKMRSQFMEQFKARPDAMDGDIDLLSFKPEGEMTHHRDRPSAQENSKDTLTRLRTLDAAARNEIHFTFNTRYMFRGAERQDRNSQSFTTTSSRTVTRLVKTYVFIRGAIVSPWFFDHVSPFLFGAISICVALLKWWQINSVVV